MPQLCQGAAEPALRRRHAWGHAEARQSGSARGVRPLHRVGAHGRMTMATNLDSVYLRAAGALPRQAARVKAMPLTAPWAQARDQPPGIADRCRAAMFGIYLRYKGIPEETARWIFQKHSGCAASWRRVVVVAHDERREALAPLVRPGIGDRCRAAMFGLYLRCKGMTDDMAREIFKAHETRRHRCVQAWFKVHGRSSADDFDFGRVVPALWEEAKTWIEQYEWAKHLHAEVVDQAMDATYRRVIEASVQARRKAGGLEGFAAQALKEALRTELTAHWWDRLSQVRDDASRAPRGVPADLQLTLRTAAGTFLDTFAWIKQEARDELISAACTAAGQCANDASDQDLRDAGGLDRFVKQALEEALRETLIQHWQERFARACAGAWDNAEVRALMNLDPGDELPSAPDQVKLRAEVTALARKAGPRAGAQLASDPEHLAIQLVAGEVGIHPAFRTIPPKLNRAGAGRASASVQRRVGGASGLLEVQGEAMPWPQPGWGAGRSRRGFKADGVSVTQHKPETETIGESLDRRWRGES